MDYLLERIHPAFLAGLIALILSILLFGLLVLVGNGTFEQYVGMCLGATIGTVIGNFIGITIYKRLYGYSLDY